MPSGDTIGYVKNGRVDKKEVWMKRYLEWDEWYPVFSLSKEPHYSRGDMYKVELSKEWVEEFEHIDKRFTEMQQELDDMWEKIRGRK